MKVGNLVIFLFLRYGKKLENVMMQIFRNMVLKIATSQRDTFKISLLLVFARLAAENASNLLNLLANISNSIQKDAISIIVKCWIENNDQFSVFGVHSNKINLFGLTKLFLLNDQRVQNLVVHLSDTLDDGETVSSRTRSKAKKIERQFSSYDKMFEIITTEYCSLLISEKPIKHDPSVDINKAVNPYFEGDDEGVDQFDDDEDFDDYDDVEDDLESVLKSAFTEQMLEDEEDDPCFEIDSLKEADLKTHLQSFFGTLNNLNAQFFNHLVSKLPDSLRKQFQQLSTKK